MTANAAGGRPSAESKKQGAKPPRVDRTQAEMSMTSEKTLRKALLTVVANENFTEAVMRFRDNSSLGFCHRVGERWAKAVGPEQREEESGLAGVLLSAITMFRLNSKHLDLQFEDGSRWDEALQEFNPGDDPR